MDKIFVQTTDIEGKKVLIEVKSFMTVDEEENIKIVPIEHIQSIEFQDNPEKIIKF